jgi:selenocysteine lyase/cysteine desulfurase
LKQMWDGLSAIDGVKLYGPPPDAPRTPTVSFTVKHHPSLEVARFLTERGLFASNGDFYAWTIVERLRLVEDGLLRAGCACYTTEEEVARLIDAIGEIARQ